MSHLDEGLGALKSELVFLIGVHVSIECMNFRSITPPTQGVHISSVACLMNQLPTPRDGTLDTHVSQTCTRKTIDGQISERNMTIVRLAVSQLKESPASETKR